VTKGRRHIEESLPGILQDSTTSSQLRCGYCASELEPCRRLVAIPGIGPVIATATIAAIGNGAALQLSKRAADLPLGWEWFQASTLPEASKH
jgi:hypothetical protein